MPRSKRQNKILELILKRDIETQDDLALALTNAGFPATQATISRDIKELGLIKVSTESGKQRYAKGHLEANVSQKIVALFKEAVLSIDSALNIVVVKTVPGSANVAGLLVDKLDNDEILGCVAGDDTTMIICRSLNSAEKLVEQLNDTLYGE